MASRDPTLTLRTSASPGLARVLRPERALPADAVRPTRAEINLAHLRHNLRVVQRAAPDKPVYAVLKADGYGHGAKAVARTLERAGVSGICVALLEEGIELREAGIRVPILVMGGYYGRAFGALLSHGLTPVLHSGDQIEALAEEVRFQAAEPVSAHLKLDTGMARLGATPSEIPALARAAQRHPEVRIQGLMTHFACAEDANGQSLDEQLERFESCSGELVRAGLSAEVRHAANSAALFRNTATHLDLVRPGIALFGVEPYAGASGDLKPVLRLRTEIVALRRVARGAAVGYGATWRAPRAAHIATVPMGYADGLSRGLSQAGEVLIRGKRAPFAGIISMDMAMIDVSSVEGVRLGDECVLLGPQRGPLGSDEITAKETAQKLGTIPWEVLTQISRRVPRFYREP